MSEKPMMPTWLHWPQTKALVQAFDDAKAAMRFVGGAVRDAVLGRTVQDIDVATPVLPDAVMELLRKANIQVIPTGIRHGTVTAIIDGKQFEITTLRKDMSCDGRHAEVAFTKDWHADADRRDFTMNALYLTPQGELHDYYNGVNDARNGYVHFIGEASDRIREDYLRILRFFRFHAWYGKGTPDVKAMAACAALAPQMASLSGERIQYEMFKLFDAPLAAETLKVMRDKQILPHVLGFAMQDMQMFSRFGAIEKLTGIHLEPFVRIAALLLKADVLPEAGLQALSARWKLSNHAEDTLYAILQYYRQIDVQMQEDQRKKLLRKLGRGMFKTLVVTAWAYGDEPIEEGHIYQAMLTLADNWQMPVFPISGDDLITLGHKPGKELGALLRTLEEAWEASHYTLAQEQLLERARASLT